MQSAQCHWIRYPSSSELALKLYLPSDKKISTLEELVEANSKVIIWSTVPIAMQRHYTLIRAIAPDVFFIELLRVTTTHRGVLVKNEAPIY